MLAVVKTPHIDLHIKGKIPQKLMKCLKNLYADKLKVMNDERVDLFETSLYKTVKKEMHPGVYVKVYRQNKSWTQNELGSKVGVSKAYISDIENNRRAVSKKMASQFAKLFDIDVSRFV